MLMLVGPPGNGPGLGARPGDSCYNPDRPSWMPYWLDTFSEEACRYSEIVNGAFVKVPAPPPGGPAPSAPGTGERMVDGSWNPGESNPDYQDWASRVGAGLNAGTDWGKVALWVGGIIALLYVLRKVKR